MRGAPPVTPGSTRVPLLLAFRRERCLDGLRAGSAAITERGCDLGVIGVGSIAAAIVRGVMQTDDGTTVLLSPRGTATSRALADEFPKVAVAPDNQAVIDRCDTVLICIRPQDADAILPGLRFRDGQTVISAMAGVRLARLRTLVGPATVCRSIPVLAVARRAGFTPIFPALPAALTLFDQLGGTIAVDDEMRFDAFSAATGTISAHIAYLAAISAWLAEQGVARADADRYVAHIFSTLDLAPTAAEPLSDLARHHATPGGVNEAFAADLAAAGLPDAVHRGLERLRVRLGA